jgi:hypothetical protein
VGTVGTGGVGVVVVPGFLAFVRVVLGFVEGPAVRVAFGGLLAAAPGVLGTRCEGRTREAAESAERDLAAVVALFSLAITGSATVTTASAAAISAANHNFLNAPSGPA